MSKIIKLADALKEEAEKLETAAAAQAAEKGKEPEVS